MHSSQDHGPQHPYFVAKTVNRGLRWVDDEHTYQMSAMSPPQFVKGAAANVPASSRPIKRL